MPLDIDRVLGGLSSDSKDLQQLIEISMTNLGDQLKCDCNSNVIEEHRHCFAPDKEDELQDKPIAYCPKGLLHLIILVIATRPNLIDEDVRSKLSSYFKLRDLKIDGLVSGDILQLLHKTSKTQTTTWLKYELLLKQLIKDHLYEPKTMSNEVLAMIKHDLDQSIAVKFSSVLKSCAEVCRKVNNQHAPDEEVEEKWCEIIDWTSWLISSSGENDFDDL